MSYSVVFTGELKPSLSQETVIKNLSLLFKKDIAFIEKLFSGPQVTIKRGLDLDNANKYKMALESAGALCEVLATQSPLQTPSPLTMAEAGETILDPAQTKPTQIDTSQYTMAAPGTQIIDTQVIEPVHINELSADLLPTGSLLNEDKPVKAVDIDTSAITLESPEQGGFGKA